MSRYTQNLYDVGAFFDRNIPTRNEFYGMVGSPKGLAPEGLSYEQRLRSMFPQTAPAAPLSIGDKVTNQMTAVQALQDKIAQLNSAAPGMDDFATENLRNEAPAVGDYGSNADKANALFGSAPLPASVAGITGNSRVSANPAPALEAQVQNINNQTMQAATGKAQEVETMSDLQKMIRAYFGGRTQEQKQKDAFMNIAAGLAAGKSPRFMDNLGTAVSGAINYGRDDTNRREKEALDFGIKNQNLDDDRYFQEGQLGLGAERNAISREQNDISRMNAARQMASNNYQMKALQKQADNLSKAITKARADGTVDAGTIGMMELQLGQVMTQLSGAGGIGIGADPVSPSADIVYDKVGSGFKQTGGK